MITILQGDVVEKLRELPDKSVHCVVTSPPYWGLRDYGVEGQIGLEKTPEEYIEKMVGVFREVWRVLRDDGTLWLNIGDSYSGSGRGPTGGTGIGNQFERQGFVGRGPSKGGENLKPKDMVGIPWRVAFALQKEGWYLRSDIIWSKPNPMPESVTDRPTKSHEYIFLLSKKARYFYDSDAIREPHITQENRPDGIIRNRLFAYDSKENQLRPKNLAKPRTTYLYDAAGKPLPKNLERSDPNTMHVWRENGMGEPENNPAGRNRRTVWEIATQPFPEAHFATFPEALVEPCIRTGTSERGCCPGCGAPWEQVVEPSGGTTGQGWHPHENDMVHGQIAPPSKSFKDYRRDMKGWQPTCKCTLTETIPCTVLDPFMGSGTTLKVARDLKRDSIGIEINPEYVKIARERLRLNEQLIGVTE